MSFEHPKVLWLAAIGLPLLALFLWATWRKRQALIRQFVQNKALAQMTLGTSTARQKLRRVILFLGVAVLLFTAARPQWGFEWEQATQRGRDIIIAIDTSRSMLAADLTPNRLTRAKLAALDLLKLGKFDRFGLVAFSGSAFLQCPLTFDDEAFRQSVEILQPGIIPQGGTAVGEAIDTARRAFNEQAEENHRVLVLFTDGEDHEAGVMSTVNRATEDGMKIFTVGVGTPTGEILRIADERGNLTYLKDEAGNVVQSKLNEELLRDIASSAGGFYVPLQGANAMEVLYSKGLAPLPTSEHSSKLLKRLKDQFYWPLAIAIVLLVIEVFIPEQKRARAKVIEAAPVLQSAGAASVAVVLAALIFSPMTFANASKAGRYFKDGQYDKALSSYQEALRKSPDDVRLHYNAGAAAYLAEKYDIAVKEFEAAAASREIDLQQQAFYNLGNAAFRLGETRENPQEKMGQWEQAIQHYDTALRLRAADEDAKFNRDLVQKKLEELKKQQQQDQKDKNKDNKDDDKKENEEKQDNQDQQKKEQQKDQEKNNEKEQDQQEDRNDQRDQRDQKDEKAQKNSEQSQQNEQKENEQQQQDPQEKKGDESNQSKPQQSGDKESDQQPPEGDGESQQVQLGKMTPAQAKQLLDAQKGEEKALIFRPTERKSGTPNRTVKDW